MTSLDAFALGKLAALDAADLRRTLRPTRRLDAIHVERDGRRLISFSCNDYLNLGRDPRVIRAGRDALEAHGAGAGASRLVTGDHPLLGELETRLAEFKGAEAACVFGSGYLANSGVIPTFAGRDDLVLMDELAHSCIRAGAKLAGARALLFRHNDTAHAEELLAAHRGQHRHCLLATEGVFSMDGDLGPLGELSEIASRYDCWLLVDDAHGLGVINDGRGTCRGLDVPLQMGTLSKALGGYGGYVCASRPAIDFLKTRAASFIYTTGLPPACVGSAIAALDIVASDPALVRRPLENARLFTGAMGLPEAQSPIVPIIVGEPAKALALSARLENEGFLVGAIRPPTVPIGTARLRVAFCAGHSAADIGRLAETMRAGLRGLN